MFVDPVTFTDEGAKVRLRAGQLLDLVADEDRLNEEKERARLVAAKFSSGEATVENVHADPGAGEDGEAPKTLMLDDDFMADGALGAGTSGGGAEDAGFVSAEAVNVAAHEAISTEVDYQDQEEKRYAQWKAQQAAAAAPPPVAVAEPDPFAAPAATSAPPAADPFAAPAAPAPPAAVAPAQADPFAAPAAPAPPAAVAPAQPDPFGAPAAPAPPAAPADMFGMDAVDGGAPAKDNISSITDMYATTNAQANAFGNFGGQPQQTPAVMPGTMAPAGGAMPGMQMPGMQMPGMQMPGMQMPQMMTPQMQMPGMPQQPAAASNPFGGMPAQPVQPGAADPFAAAVAPAPPAAAVAPAQADPFAGLM